MKLEQVQAELPGWSVHRFEAHLGHAECWQAISPTWQHDGITISAPSPGELIARVRSMVRIVELAAGRPAPQPHNVVGGMAFHKDRGAIDGSPAPALVARDAASPPIVTHRPPAPRPAEAMTAFTGESCIECGSMAMVRSGTCSTCADCGATSGCS